MGEIPEENPRRKRGYSDPAAALNGAIKAFDLPITYDEVSVQAMVSDPDSAKSNPFILKGASGTFSDPKARLMYFTKPDGKLALTWKVETDLLHDWLSFYVDAESSETVHGTFDHLLRAYFEV